MLLEALVLDNGIYLAIIGAALAVALSGTGSAIGVGNAGRAAAAITAESPDKFSKLLVLQLLPATQGIYGFLVAIMVFLQINLLGGDIVVLTLEQGFSFFMACMPIAIAGLTSGIYQGKVSVAGMNMIAKRPEESGKAIIMTVMVETYAILGLLVSILAVVNIL